MVKNEERWLWYSVCSVVDYVDKILLWDTGSTDGTINIINALIKKYPNKIVFREVGEVDAEGFEKVRQEMLDDTKSDWILMLDGDEIWYKDSITTVIERVKNKTEAESIVVPTINLVGDVFHFQEEKAGRYKFGGRIGHYNLRAIKRSIPGLHSQGVHGVWGWADATGKQIQERNTYKFIDAPYVHATFIGRGKTEEYDKKVVKRKKKLKYEIGKPFPLDFYYPEVFFLPRPSIIPSPWVKADKKFVLRATAETPVRKLKRRVWYGPVGY